MDALENENKENILLASTYTAFLAAKELRGSWTHRLSQENGLGNPDTACTISTCKLPAMVAEIYVLEVCHRRRCLTFCFLLNQTD